MSLQIEGDLDWRLAELAVFREVLTSDTSSEIRKNVLFRAAWTLLYAHYEGFCKFALQSYGELLNELPDCTQLSRATFIYLHEKTLRKVRQTDADAFFEFLSAGLTPLHNKNPPIKEVDTKSNLWPDLLENLLYSFDIPAEFIKQDRLKLRALVGRRNDIAHGQKVFIKDMTYYLEYESAVQNVLYALACSIIDQASAFNTSSQLCLNF